mgnify:CR=1 FL=1
MKKGNLHKQLNRYCWRFERTKNTKIFKWRKWSNLFTWNFHQQEILAGFYPTRPYWWNSHDLHLGAIDPQKESADLHQPANTQICQILFKLQPPPCSLVRRDWRLKCFCHWGLGLLRRLRRMSLQIPNALLHWRSNLESPAHKPRVRNKKQDGIHFLENRRSPTQIPRGSNWHLLWKPKRRKGCTTQWGCLHYLHV